MKYEKDSAGCRQQQRLYGNSSLDVEMNVQHNENWMKQKALGLKSSSDVHPHIKQSVLLDKLSHLSRAA